MKLTEHIEVILPKGMAETPEIRAALLAKLKPRKITEIIGSALDDIASSKGVDAEQVAAFRLANAAPDLLEACKLSLGNAEGFLYQMPAKMENSGDALALRKWKEILEAAIAKAEGRAK